MDRYYQEQSQEEDNHHTEDDDTRGSAAKEVEADAGLEYIHPVTRKAFRYEDLRDTHTHEAFEFRSVHDYFGDVEAASFQVAAAPAVE